MLCERQTDIAILPMYVTAVTPSVFATVCEFHSRNSKGLQHQRLVGLILYISPQVDAAWSNVRGFRGQEMGPVCSIQALFTGDYAFLWQRPELHFRMASYGQCSQLKVCWKYIMSHHPKYRKIYIYIYTYIHTCVQTKNKLRGLSLQVNYTDRATAACRRS
jgi:hypothetical protein